MMLATSLALGAAVLHATWNLLLKTAPGEDRDVSSWGIFLVGGALVLPVSLALGGPGRAAVPWLALSATIHIAYVTGLVAAYRHGDFSLAYPLARGTGAVVAAVGGSMLLGDRLPVGAWLAIVVVAAGLAGLVGRTVTGTTVRDALGTGVAIGAYTLADARGARVSTDAVAYGLITTSAAAAAISVAFLLRGRGPALVRALPGQWRRWTVGGLCTAVAYAMVMVATRHAEVGYVAMLRESSVVVGALVGWRVLRERLGGRRLVASVIVLAGLIGLVVARAA